MITRFDRRLIAKEVELGFLYIPASARSSFPSKDATVPVHLGDGKRPSRLTYNAKHRRIFGLTGWYRGLGVRPKDVVRVEVLKEGAYRLARADDVTPEQEYSAEEVREIIDLSGLSSVAKGDIVEDRIKDQIVLFGQGLLSVYRPVSDHEGIDLIVVKNGVFQPIFIQVKGRFNLQRSGAFLCDTRMKSFRPHHSYFLVGAFFDPSTLALSDYLLFVPTEVVANEGALVNTKDPRRRVMTALSPNTKSKWAPYVCTKQDLVNRIFAKFAEIERFLK